MSRVISKRRVMSMTSKGAIVLCHWLDLSSIRHQRYFACQRHDSSIRHHRELYKSSTSLIYPLSKVAATLGVKDLLEWDHWVMSTTLEVSYFRYRNSHLCKWRVMSDSSAWSKLLLRDLNRVRGMRVDSAWFVMVPGDLSRFWVIWPSST